MAQPAEPIQPKRRSGKPPSRTVEQMADALRANAGVVKHAARMLKVNPSTLQKHIAKHQELMDLLVEVREDMLDIAQSRVAKLLDKPGHKDHAKVCMFILRTLGRKRGFVERHELVGPKEGDTSAGPVKVTFYLPQLEDD